MHSEATASENPAELKSPDNRRFESLSVECGPQGGAGTGVPPPKVDENTVLKQILFKLFSCSYFLAIVSLNLLELELKSINFCKILSHRERTTCSYSHSNKVALGPRNASRVSWCYTQSATL